MAAKPKKTTTKRTTKPKAKTTKPKAKSAKALPPWLKGVKK